MSEKELQPNTKIGSMRLMERDIEILEMLFQYRALLPEQLANYYDISLEVMRKRMNKLCNEDIVKKTQLKRYRVRQNRQGVVYAISTLGVKILKNNPSSVEKFKDKLDEFTTSNVRLETNHLPFVLNANDVGLELYNYGWEYFDSREAKERFALNRQLLLHGLLQDSNGKDMWYYGYQENITLKTFRMLASELESTRVIQNVLITYKGLPASNMLHKLINPVMYGGRKIYPVSNVTSLKIMDFEFAKSYFACFLSDDDVYRFINGYYKKWIEIVGEYKAKKKMAFVNVVANLKEYDSNQQLVRTQSVLVANVLDMDLVKINELRRYNQEAREREGMNLILIIREKDKDIIKSYFHSEAYKHIGFFVVKDEYVESYKAKI